MEICPECNRSDKIQKVRTIEPMSNEEEVKSFVCMRCMYIVATEGSDLEAIIYQLKREY